MKFRPSLRRFLSPFLTLGLLFSGLSSLSAQLLTWDAAPTTGGIQNGTGTWNMATSNWVTEAGVNGLWDNSGNAIAQFGGLPGVAANVVTVSGSMNLKGLNFLAVNTTTPVAGQQYTINGAAAGTVLNFGEGGVIQISDFASGGSQFLSLGGNIVMQGSNLTLKKPAASTNAIQFINLSMASNPNLTGNMTVGANIYAGISSIGAISNLSRITVQTNGTLTLGTSTANLAVPLSISGHAQTYGAVRVTGNNLTLSGGIQLDSTAGILMHSGNTGLAITAPITDGGAGHGLFLYSLTKNDGTVRLTAANTYGGTTTLGRETVSGYTGVNAILDFSAATAPQQDVLYNGLATPGGLDFIGNTIIGRSVLTLQGANDEVNSQRLGNLNVGGQQGVIQLISGTGGEMNLSIGTVSRNARGLIAFIAPQSGQISTTHPDAFLGAWATYETAGGVRTWAQAQGGVISGFTGETAHVTGQSLTSDVTKNLKLDASSYGTVSQTGALTYLNTLSMTDTELSRTVALSGGATLRLGTVGGVQITSEAKSLTIGQVGVASFLSAGGEATGATQLILTNNSTTSLLTLHSGLANNVSGGALTLLVNGARDSRTILTAAGTMTGGATISSGNLELRHGNALGTAGTINVIEEGSLQLADGITFNRAIAISGVRASDPLVGRLHNLRGDNTVGTAIVLLAPSNITSGQGTLKIQLATAATTAISGTHALTLGGTGDIIVNGRIAIGTGVLTKIGNGRLTLNGDNTHTGATTISAGTIHAMHANALGTIAGATTINAGAALELSNNISVAEPITNASNGVNNDGGIRNVSGTNVLTGLITLGGTTTRINSDSGMLTFNAATGNSIVQTSTSARTLVFGGAGDIQVLKPIARTAIGGLTLTKDGAGTTTLMTTVNNTATIINAGVLHLDFSAAESPVSNILNNAGVGTLTLTSSKLKITGRTSAVNAQTLGNLTINNYANIEMVQNGASSLNLTFGTLTRAWHSVLGIDLPTAGAIQISNGEDGQAMMSDGRVYAFIRDAVGGDEWAATTVASGGLRNIVKLSSLGGYTASTATSLAGHADIDSGVLITRIPADTSLNSLRFAATQATTVTQDIAGRTLDTGGILVSSTVGANTTTISTTILRPTASVNNNPELLIVQNNVLGDLVIDSRINNRTESGRTTVSVIKAGPGNVIMNGANGFSGHLRVYEGSVQFGAGSVSANMEFLLGYGSGSGKIILGQGSNAFNATIEYIDSQGVGGGNSIVGGASALSNLTLTGSTTNISNFVTARLGGIGFNENNLSLTYDRPNATLTLGAVNSYTGQTIIRQGSVDITLLDFDGMASSFGSGSSAPIIEVGSATTGTEITAKINYIGTTDSYTNRPLNISNSTSTVTKVTAVLENNGKGVLNFLAPFTSTGTNITAERKLILGGSQTGFNAIVGIGDNGVAPTSLEKNGLGTWVLSGANAYSGGTTVNGGRLYLANDTGSATGHGGVTVQQGAILGGNGSMILDSGRNVVIAGATLQVGMDLPGMLSEASTLTIQTTGAGMLHFMPGSDLLLDLFTGAGQGDNAATLAASDRLIFGGSLSVGENFTLRVSNPTNMESWAANDQWRLFDWADLTSPVIGNVAQYDLPTLPEGLMWNTADLFTTGILSITLVPEPSKALLLFVAMVAGLARRRRMHA